MGAVEVTSANTFATGFILVNAASNTDVRPVLHGDTLVLSELPPELSIRAVVTGGSEAWSLGTMARRPFKRKIFLLTRSPEIVLRVITLHST